MKLYSLQILRAYAAISVVITHVFQKSNFKPFGECFLSGQYGVDIFFILSGFLIYITTKNYTSHWIYLKKRLFRIYPLS
jgi:peptidoglycan/LPS O-acetylase OafA/YrhL